MKNNKEEKLNGDKADGMLSLPLSEIKKFAEWMEQKYKKGECVGVDGWNRDTTQYSGVGLLTIWLKESGNESITTELKPF